ncbi:unnamed protein product [Bathycoccus prasinos]|jgi:hypothetical protein
MATITISGGLGGVLKNVLTLIGIALILINFEGALISPRKALNKFYGIRHENSIQVHLMQLLCCVRLGLGFILLSTRLSSSKERFRIATIAFVTMSAGLKSMHVNKLPNSTFDLKNVKGKFGFTSTDMLEFKLFFMTTLIGVGIVCHMFEPGLFTKDKNARVSNENKKTR